MLFLQAIALVLITLGGFIAALNWVYLYLSWYTGRFHSAIPLMGGLFMCLGMLLLPATRPYAWTAVLLDYSMLGFLLALPHIVNEVWSTSRYNLLEEYSGQLGVKTVHLRLFRKSIFILELRIQREYEEHGVTRLSIVGDWEREGNRLLLRLNQGSADFETTPDGKTLRHQLGFPSWEGTELSLAGMDLQLKYKRTG